MEPAHILDERAHTATVADRRTRSTGVMDDVISIVFGTAMSVVALLYIATSFLLLLVAWEVLAVVYLLLVLTILRNRSIRSDPSQPRALPRRVLEYLSWAFPIVASTTGVASAVTLLTMDGPSGGSSTQGWVVGLLGSIGVIVAWALLQTGFAEIYESCYAQLADKSMITFPGRESDPTLGDFLYLAFMVGTTASPDGATIASRKARRLILIHSITSFFYNAFLIAIAIQVLQGIITHG